MKKEERGKEGEQEIERKEQAKQKPKKIERGEETFYTLIFFLTQK